MVLPHLALNEATVYLVALGVYAKFLRNKRKNGRSYEWNNEQTNTINCKHYFN